MEKLKAMALYTDFRKELIYIEKELENAVQSDSPLIQQASIHLLRAGGKRIRPIFVFLSSKFGDYSMETTAKVAVSLELVHMASLVHDDVIDDSNMRRGRKTVKAKWDNRVAMYTGDFIFSRALTSIGEIEMTSVHQLLADTMLEICKGEIIQFDYQRRTDQSFRDYLRRIKRKTALLLSSSCELGALISNADDEVVRRLRNFGYYAGMAFQIVDDILDLTSSDKQLGKPAGSDLLNGHLTLPVLYIRNEPSFQPYLAKAFAGTLSEKERGDMLRYIRESGAIEKAHEVSDLYLEKATAEIRLLPDSDAKKAFEQVAEFLAKRTF